MSLNKNISASILTQIPVFVLSVITGVFITRLLGVEEKGVFSLFQTNIQFFVLFFTLSMTTGITYFIANSKIPLSNILGMALQIVLIGSILIILMLFLGDFIGIDDIFFPNGFSAWSFKLYLFFSFFSTVMNSVFSSVFQGRSRFKFINQISIYSSLIQFVVFGALFILKYFDIYTVGIEAALLVTISVLIFNSIYWVVLYSKEIGILPEKIFLKDQNFRLFYVYVFSIYIGTLINFMNYKLDLWIINYYINEYELGIYSLSGNIVQLFLMISVVVSSVLLPYLSRCNDISDKIKIFRIIARINFLFILLGVIFTFCVCGFLIPMIYGIEFSDSVEPLRIILPGVLFSCATQLFATLIVASNRNFLNILATLGGLVITVILDLNLIPEYGINGAAWATSFAYMFTFLFTFLLCVFVLKMPAGNYFIPSLSELKIGIVKLKSYVYNR